MTASAGDTTARFAMKSLRWESPSSPIGVSQRDWHLLDLEHLAHFRRRNVHLVANLCRRGFAPQRLLKPKRGPPLISPIQLCGGEFRLKVRKNSQLLRREFCIGELPNYIVDDVLKPPIRVMEFPRCH
jgi:hypothetical protein